MPNNLQQQAAVGARYTENRLKRHLHGIEAHERESTMISIMFEHVAKRQVHVQRSKLSLEMTACEDSLTCVLQQSEARCKDKHKKCDMVEKLTQ